MMEQISSTEYRFPLLKDSVQVDTKAAPVLEFSRFGGDRKLGIELAVSIPNARKQVFLNEVWYGDPTNMVIRAFPLDPTIITGMVGDPAMRDATTVQNQYGGFEFAFVLYRRPGSNIFPLNMNLAGLDVFPNPDPGSPGAFPNTSCPENVINSFALCHDTQSKMLMTRAEFSKFEGGKFGQLYRVRYWYYDHAGYFKQGWGKTSFTGTRFDIEIPWSALDDADYSRGFVIDPTLGYDVQGASGANMGDDIYAWIGTTDASGGDVDSMFIYTHTWGAGMLGTGAIWLQSTGAQVANSVTAELAGAYADGSKQTHTYSAPKASLAASTGYYVGWHYDASNHGCKYDSGTGSNTRLQTNLGVYPTMPDPWTGASSSANRVSCGCVYNPAGGGGDVVTPEVIRLHQYMR